MERGDVERIVEVLERGVHIPLSRDDAVAEYVAERLGWVAEKYMSEALYPEPLAEEVRRNYESLVLFAWDLFKLLASISEDAGRYSLGFGYIKPDANPFVEAYLVREPVTGRYVAIYHLQLRRDVGFVRLVAHSSKREADEELRRIVLDLLDAVEAQFGDVLGRLLDEKRPAPEDIAFRK